MRAGICSIQLQALTPEAANVVKQAVNLATRRGHAQVTPLHVASAMLATSTGLLRRACLQCHSHPLQCKALELCFNVALNRLPASTPSPLLGPHYGTHCNSNNNPSLSNALVAAFKRAQSHQRRGSIETQNQPILSLKIEIEQLVISILDDPSVSRVMREAGFSSTLVKSKVEQSVSVEISSQQQQNATSSVKSKPPPPHHQAAGHHFEGSLVLKPIIKSDRDHNNDVETVVSQVLNRRRNVIVVSESVGTAEGLARGVMERIGNVVQVVSVPLESFRNKRKEEVERKILEIRSLVKSYIGSRGIVFYLGDLKWLFEFWESHCCMNQKEMMMIKSYCSVEHMVMEMKRLVSESDGGEMSGNRVCLMGISTLKMYIKCKTNCHPSLESLWELYPFTVPVPSLSLSLNIHSDLEAQDGWFEDGVSGVRKNLTCCGDCSVSFEREAQSIIQSSRLAKKEYSSATAMSLSCSSSRLPTWLQNCKQETRGHPLDDKDNERLRDLCKKWNCFCSTIHRHTCNNMQLLSEAKEPKSECELYADDVVCYEGGSSNLIMFLPTDNNNNKKPDLLSNPNSSPNSASSSEAMDGLDSTHMFKDLNEENLKILCDALDTKLSSQRYKHVVHEISSTVLRCRSGISSRENRKKRQDTWMLFLGGGECKEEKENVSRELAKTVFGSYTNFIAINGLTLSSSASSAFSSDDENIKKRKRTGDDDNNDERANYLQRFGEALNENPHRVFFIMQDLDEAEKEEDEVSRRGIKEAIESGGLRLNGEMIPLKDAIVILSCDDPPRRPEKKKIKNYQSLCLDLNIAIDSDGDCSSRTGILELVDEQIVFNTQEKLIGDHQGN